MKLIFTTTFMFMALAVAFMVETSHVASNERYESKNLIFTYLINERSINRNLGKTLRLMTSKIAKYNFPIYFLYNTAFP